MSEVSGPHTYEVADLRALETALNTLKTECDSLQAQAMSASGTASAQWSGPSNSDFVMCVQMWNATAASVSAYAESLAGWVGAAATNYESAQQAASGMWGGGSGGGGGGRHAPTAI